jgi:hypothetical protein
MPCKGPVSTEYLRSSGLEHDFWGEQSRRFSVEISTAFNCHAIGLIILSQVSGFDSRNTLIGVEHSSWAILDQLRMVRDEVHQPVCQSSIHGEATDDSKALSMSPRKPSNN